MKVEMQRWVGRKGSKSKENEGTENKNKDKV